MIQAGVVDFVFTGAALLPLVPVLIGACLLGDWDQQYGGDDGAEAGAASRTAATRPGDHRHLTRIKVCRARRA
jgi:hypothetical protein